MKLGVLTSSRADYGIYTPLLKKLSNDNRFELELIVFGMHLLENQGNTIHEIEKDAFGLIHQVNGMPTGDKKLDIACGYGELVKQFAAFWNEHNFDCILVLGDRWEVSAAVQAALPYELVFAHLFGGETTLGAVDNIYRHQISLASKYHFTATDEYSKRVAEITGKTDDIYTVGSVSIEDIENLTLPEWETIKDQFGIDFDNFVLVTIHPESIKADRNRELAKIVHDVLEHLVSTNHILITRSNSDIMGSIFNNLFESLATNYPAKIKLVSSLGRLNYFKAMQQCSFMLGNTSSGIVEAASFQKWVINIGDRQAGRLRNRNVIDVPFIAEDIIASSQKVRNLKPFDGQNKFVKSNTSDEIINVLLSNEKL